MNDHLDSRLNAVRLLFWVYFRERVSQNEPDNIDDLKNNNQRGDNNILADIIGHYVT